MKFRTTLIFALILGVLAAYVYFFEFKKPKEKAKQEEEEKKLFKVNWDNLKGITIANTNGHFVIEKTKVKKGDAEVDQWRITSPIEADAENSTIDSLITTLKNLKLERVIAEDPKGLTAFGLSEPRIKIGVLLKEGEQPAQLLVGAKSPVGYNCYAMIEGEKNVVLASTDLGTQFDKKLYDFREKKLFEFKREDVERIAVEKQGGKLFEVEKKGERWDMVFPFKARVSETELNKILNKLTGLRADTFEDEDSTHSARYGLDKPQWKIDVTLSPDHAVTSLSLGKGFEKDSTTYVYAARTARPTIFGLKDDIISAIDKKAEDLREKKILPFKSWEIRKLELTQGEDTVTLAKDEQSKWNITSPITARASSSKVTSFLSALSQLEAVRFVTPVPPEEARSAYGVTRPLAKVTLYEKEDKKVGTIRIGQDAKKGTAYYADTEEGDILCEIKSEFVTKELPQGIGDLREKRLLDFYRYQVARIEATDGASKIVAEKKGGTWKLSKPQSRSLEDKDIDSLLTLLTDVEAEHYVAEQPQDLSPYGLDKPSTTITLSNEKNETIGTLLLSSKGPEDRPDACYAKEAKDPWVAVIKVDSRNKIQETLSSLAKKD